MKNRILVYFFALIFISVPIVAAEEVTLTVDEAIAIALRDNRDILLKAEDVKKAKYKINEAWSSTLPAINLTGAWTRAQEYYSKDFSSYSSQAGIKQILYQGGKIINTIQYDKHGLTVAQAVLDKAKLEIVASTKRAFYTLILANDFASLNENILKNSQQHLDSLRLKYNSGQASKQDILNIESSMEAVKQAYEASLNQLEASKALLNSLLYLDKDVKIITVGNFTYTPKEIAYDQAFLRAMKDRPEIREYEAKEKAAEKTVEITKASGRPTVYASWDYYSRSHISTGTARDWNDHNVIGITLSWPVFDGWLTKSKVDQAIVELKQAKLLNQKLAQDIALELKNAYIDLKNTLTKLTAVESDMLFYSDNLAGTKEKYRQGIVSTLDLSDADLKHAIARFNRNEAVYNYTVAKINFDKAAGGM